MTCKPYGKTLSGDVPTDIKFTGQRLDATGLYFYNARYYDAFLERFISPDPITHSKPLPYGQIIKGLTVYRTTPGLYTGQTRNPLTVNPQEHNRYSYALNNPYRYTDPDGHQVIVLTTVAVVSVAALSLYAYMCATQGQTETADAINQVIDQVADTLRDVGRSIREGISGAWSSFAGFFRSNDNGEKEKGLSNTNSGTSKAPKQSEPNSDYHQVDENGNIRSHTHYDEYGYPDYREDWDHSQGDTEGPHRHDFLFDENGHMIDSDDTIILP